MRAVVHDRYGPPEVLRVEDIPQPVPGNDEVLIKIHATTVNRTDCALRAAEPFFSRFITGIRRPRERVLGSEFAGTVESLGSAVTEFKVGDRVFGEKPWKFGAHADYICMQENAALAHMPEAASFDEAGAVCDGALLALNCLRPGKVRSGQSILIYGASGAIGTAAVQLAKAFRAHVTAVCGTKNVELVRSLGADEVIDYMQTDFTKNGQTYDAVFDAVGKVTFGVCKRSLKAGGVFLATDGMRNIALAAWTARFHDRKVIFDLPPKFLKKDVVMLAGLMDAGRYRAVIDRRYPLEDVVEATKYVETHQKVGNVVLTLDPGVSF